MLLLGLFAFLFLGVLLGRVIRFFGPADKNKTNRRKTGNNSQSSNTANNTPKKFSKTEGEYVNYEEVRDEE